MATQKKPDETLVEGIVHRLEEAIVSGAILPNERLDEQKLAARFGASRTPVREAIRHLAASGLIEVRPRKGAVVAEIPVRRRHHRCQEQSGLPPAHVSGPGRACRA